MASLKNRLKINLGVGSVVATVAQGTAAEEGVLATYISTLFSMPATLLYPAHSHIHLHSLQHASHAAVPCT